ncbi:MAG: glutamate--tRNA ligase [Chitinophagaceae bacterium]
MKKIRVRFAPSPTGGLHLGGVRTILFNYLFAKKYQGDFILRIEDTDRNRYIEGAEQYIIDCLKWCNLMPDEGPFLGGPFAPYRQSERKELYLQYALQLVQNGYAYYAFDTPEELDAMRLKLSTPKNPSPQYDHKTRMQMRNSLTLRKEETIQLIEANMPFVIRIKIPKNEKISFTDMIRGHVEFDSNLLDDKVLLKADQMPTYHLAVVIDDYLMKISHVFRGEEWLPSAGVHLLLWTYLGWEKEIPKWAHLPLILKPDGNGKLSKRDGDRLGFPVYAMDWQDKQNNITTQGFKELGFLPDAFLNMLALLGWNNGTEQEIFTRDELIQKFDITRLHKAGAKFDFEKAKWFNHQYIQKIPNEVLANYLIEILKEKNISFKQNTVIQICTLIKERCSLLTDLYTQSAFFFTAPKVIDIEAIKNKKWGKEKVLFMKKLISHWENIPLQHAIDLENNFKNFCTQENIKTGEVMLPLRVMLVGGKFGPHIFNIIEIIGLPEALQRIKYGLSLV